MFYFDNAATSRFKPQEVMTALKTQLMRSANSGRSAHKDAIAAAMTVERTRNFLAQKLGADQNYAVVFTKSCTEALNLALFGYVKGGERILTTANEHNSVLRPLYELERRGLCSVAVCPQQEDGRIDLKELEEAAKGCDLIAVGMACNVTGIACDIAEIGEIARRCGAKLLVDGAQGVPVLDIDMAYDGVDMLALPGHKGLHGLQGTGALIVKRDITLTPLIYGGTGSYSDSVYQPLSYPEAYEAGTQFTGGIAALYEGAKWSFEHRQTTRKKFTEFTKTALYVLKNIGYTALSQPNAVGIVAFNLGEYDSEQVAQMLDEDNIAVRAGLHCAPLVHRHLGTLSQGAVRISCGVETSVRDQNALFSSLERIYAKLK